MKCPTCGHEDSAPKRQSAPNGWKLVPIEPTLDMLDAPATIIQRHGAELIYRRMLEAAPGLWPQGDASEVKLPE